MPSVDLDSGTGWPCRLGWSVITVWECQLGDRAVANRLQRLLAARE